MPKKKLSSTSLNQNLNQKLNNFKQLIDKYDSVTLIGALNTLEDSVAWQIYQAYCAKVQREYEVMALDLVGKEVKGAAYASGYARCAEDMQENFVKGLKETLLNISPVVENPRVEDSLL